MVARISAHALGRSAAFPVASAFVRPVLHSPASISVLSRPRTAMAATAFILGAVAATGGFAVLAGGSALAGILWEGRGRYGRGRYQYKDHKGYGEEEKDEEKKKKEEEEEKKRRKKKDKERKQGKGPGGFSLRHDRSVPEGDAGGDASATEEQLLNGLRREDAAWCGLRLLCELAATAEANAEDLGEEELALLNLIG